MGIATADSLVATLCELGLVDPGQGDELRQLAGGRSDARDLARHLIQREVVTAFQVNQILQGKGKQLLLGPYLLLERLGHGGMGEVFKGRHQKLHRLAAIKVISPQKMDHAALVERFKREVQATAELSHANIVSIQDAGEAGGMLYLAMELLDGIDLSRLVAQAGPLPVDLACEFVRQAALGLQHAHQRGFVHRDVKPQNLMASPHGGMKHLKPDQLFAALAGATVKVLDLGLIRRQVGRDEETELELTQKGIVIGTVDYLAPEQAMNSHGVDHRVDLYSLGCTFHFLLTGQVPFPGSDPLAKLLRHQAERPMPIRQVRPDVSARLEALVGRLMAKSPGDRPQSAAEVVSALVPLCEEAPGTVVVQPTEVVAQAAEALSALSTRELDPGQREEPTTQSTPQLPPSRRRGRERTSNRWQWVVGASAVVVLLLLGTSLVFKPAPPTDREKQKGRSDRVAASDPRLGDYFPPDSAAVVFLQPKALLGTEIVRTAAAGPGQLPGDPGLLEVFTRAGLLSGQDVQSLRLVFTSGSADQPLRIVRGSFDAEKLRRLPAEPTGPGSRSVLLRLTTPGRPTVYVATHAPYLLASPRAEALNAALDHARKETKSEPQEDALRQVVARVDKKQQLWLAALPPLLGTVPSLTKDAKTNEYLRQVLGISNAISGGLLAGDQLEASFQLDGRDNAAAAAISKALTACRATAKARLSAEAGKLTAAERLWLHLTADAKVAQRGATVRVTGQVTLANLEAGK